MTTTITVDGLPITIDDVKHAILILGAEVSLREGELFSFANVITRGSKRVTLGYFTNTTKPTHHHAVAFAQMCSKAVAELRTGV